MKSLKKPLVKRLRKQDSASEKKSCSGKIQITIVSAQERDTYRVPSYGYILP